MVQMNGYQYNAMLHVKNI